MVECRDEMNSTDNVCGVNEAKCWWATSILCILHKHDSWQTMSLPSRLIARVWILAIQVHSCDIQIYGINRAWVANDNMIQPDDAGIPVGVSIRIFIMWKHHDICMHARVQWVLFSPHIIGCVIDPKDFMLVEAIVDEFQGSVLFISEQGVIVLVVTLKNSAEQVISQLIKKSLR